MKILQVDSSIQGESSATRALTSAITRQWHAAYPAAEVSHRDLAAQELPHLSGQAFSRTDELEAARNAVVLEEFLAADVVIIGAPLYNFSIPSQLKAWIDRISVAGRTFRYTDKGPVGLVRGKQVIIAIARGGTYEPGSPAEFGESYLRFLFGFLGVQAVSFVRAEGLALSAEHRAAALRAAHEAIPAPAPMAA